MPVTQFPELIGKIMKRVYVSADKKEMYFETTEGKHYKFYHEQDCCEQVLIEDICGDLEDLVGIPILLAECVSGKMNTEDSIWESGTWTFYKFATNKESVTVRWVGHSNGYYSEQVYFTEITGGI